MDNSRILSLIKSFLFVVLMFITLVAGYMVGYQIRAAHSIYMINNILLHEIKNTTNDRTMLLCARTVLQDSVRNFYLLPEYDYLKAFIECEGLQVGIVPEHTANPFSNKTDFSINTNSFKVEPEKVEPEKVEPEKVEPEKVEPESLLPYANDPKLGSGPYREIK